MKPPELPPLPRSTLLLLGPLGGGLLGAAGGAAEALLAPLGEPLRVPYAMGADGAVGTLWGLLAALGLAAGTAARPADRTAGRLLGALLFPGLAAALGLLANRALLPGTHFLAPVSLAADGLAAAAALAIALLAGRASARRIRRRSRFPEPRPAALAALLLGLAAALFAPPRLLDRGAPSAGRPPIVLVSIDTLRPDRLSGGGDPRPTSPEIDRLCREGLLFPEAVTVSPGSAASHAALLTSRYPVSNGVFANFSVLDRSVETFAETLRAKGYRTGAFVTNTFLGRRFGFDQGFDAYVESGVVERLEEPSGAVLFRSLALVQLADRVRSRLDRGFDPSFRTALAWIAESNRPTFLFVHVMDVHSPYAPPPPWGERFGARRGGDPRAPRRAPNRFGWRPSEEAYAAEVRFADTKVGRLRRALEERGWLDGGLVALTSDHGENLLDHEPFFSHGATMYDATLRVLVSLRAPGRLRRGRIDPVLFENVDLLPTIGDLLGWEPPRDWEGRSHAPRGARAPRRIAFAQLGRDFALRSREWKVLLPAKGEPRLWDLERDPGESRPFADPERIAAARVALKAWRARHETPLYREGARTVAPGELSPETREKLRALGYLD